MKKMLQLIKYNPHLLAYGICVLFWCLTTGSIINTSITSDEVSHIASGYYYLTTGRYALNPEHPPLIKELAALPLLFLQPTSPINSDAFSLTDEIHNEQWQWGELFLFQANQQSDVMILLARLTIITLNTCLFFWCYYVIKQQWDNRAAVLFLIATIFNPFILAHSALVTMDVPAALLQIISLLYAARWLKQGSGIGLVIISTTLALLTKFSAALLVPVILIGLILYAIVTPSIRVLWKTYCRNYLIIVLACISLVTSVYVWQTRNMTSAMILIQLNTFYPVTFPEFGLTILQELTHLSFITRGITEFIHGNILLSNRLGIGNETMYFFNHIYTHWQVSIWYFPIVFLTKLPLLLLGWMLVSCIVWLLKLRKSILEPAQLLLSVYIITYSVVTFNSLLQIGLRHIMPLIIMLIVLMSVNLTQYFTTLSTYWKKIAWQGFIMSVIILAINLVYNFPYYLSYYNWLGGGAKYGYQISTDSNYDWGQDVKRLADWVNNTGVTTLYVDVFSPVPIQYYLGFKPVSFNPDTDPLPPAGTYLAISTFQYKNKPIYSTLPLHLVTRAGMSILIFQVE